VAPGIAPSPQIEELRGLSVSGINQMLRGEQNQMWALVLAQLDPQISAEVFKTMESPFRADVMRRLARIEPVSPEVLDRVIQDLLARKKAHVHL
jgi:flagellar motor switch protein FliG